MLRIGLMGYGKMGRAIDALAAGYSAEVVWRLGRDEMDAIPEDILRQAEVVIEFTRPEAAWNNVRRCIEAGVPVVSGTTGWTEQLPAAEGFCRERGGAMIWASNFSLGVNLFFALNEYLAGLMADKSDYRPEITEIHHVHKLDAPSGTALTLAGQIVAARPELKGWKHAEAPEEQLLPIRSIREGEVPGTHRIEWRSSIDTISIAHEAHTREGFAAGALLAAKWLRGRRGVFTMADVLGIKP